MEWDDEMVLEFLHNYEDEPSIWDPKNVNNKKKHLVAEAWRRLKSNLSFGDSTSVDELKKKKNSLMAYYRIHLNKIKNLAPEESYKTSWFAFSTMHNFLGPIYDECSSGTIKTEVPMDESYDSDESSSSSQRDQTVDSTSIRKKRKLDMPDPLQAKKQLNDAYLIIKESANLNKTEKVNECDLYAQLLAEKLKKIDEDRRIILMHNIDNLVFKELMSSMGQDKDE